MTKLPFGPIKLYTSGICPFAQRTTIALHELGLIHNIDAGVHRDGDVDIVEIDLSNKPDWYKTVNPRGKVPALEITHTTDGKKEVLVESALIAEFLLQSSNHPALLYSDPIKRYRAGIVIDAISNQYIGAFYGLLKEKVADNQPAAAAKLLDAIRAVQDTLVSSEGPYALGAEFSIADIISAPFLARLSVNEHYRGFTIPKTDEFKRFHQWFDALRARPSIKDTTATKERLVAAYRAYAE
ncbi:glutathione S-transferase [Blastocladiella britannica]|nr:glutathione S-transferase [Blastocladiella britannica]